MSERFHGVGAAYEILVLRTPVRFWVEPLFSLRLFFSYTSRHAHTHPHTSFPLTTLYSHTYWMVSWCSWLSHHFHVVRVPGSNPGGTILTTLLLPWNASLLYVPCLYTFLLLYPFMSWVFCLECLYMSSHSVGSYQVGYTRSHPNTEVKMLRAC